MRGDKVASWPLAALSSRWEISDSIPNESVFLRPFDGISCRKSLNDDHKLPGIVHSFYEWNEKRVSHGKSRRYSFPVSCPSVVADKSSRLKTLEWAISWEWNIHAIGVVYRSDLLLVLAFNLRAIKNDNNCVWFCCGLKAVATIRNWIGKKRKNK